MIVSHYDRPLDDRAKLELHPQHTLKHRSQYQKVVVDLERRAPKLRKNDVSYH
jgi:hypothetical protein